MKRNETFARSTGLAWLANMNINMDMGHSGLRGGGGEPERK